MYEPFYHLQAKPFRLSPDPGFFFESRGHKRALAYLRYGLNQGEGFVVITGAPGTGKTTLAQILLQEMSQSDMVVAHLTTTQLEADDMLRMVAASFGLRYEGLDKTGLLKALEAFLLSRSRERKRALLVIDEAQNLPARSLEELRMLSNLQVGDQALLQTFLLGQTQFRQMLEHPDLEQLRQRVIANYHLGELAADECASYIESRLRQVGWDGDPHFTENAYEIIYEYTEGVPRRINMLCDRILLFICLEERHTVDEVVLREVTDELQQEVSGRPPPRVELSKERVSAPVEASVVEAVLEGVQPVEIETADAKPHESADVVETPETKKAAADDFAPAPLQADIHRPVITSPDDSVMNRVVPDTDWNQSVAQAQVDVADVDDDEKSQEKDRFRLISGGKDSSSRSLETDTSTRPANNPASVVMTPIPDAPGDSEEVVLRKILRLVLAFHRSPRSFPGLDDPIQPLPKGIRAILTLAVSEDDALKNLRQIAVMGISPDMLRAAVRFFVRRVLFMPGSDDFHVLGLPFGASQADIELHYGLLMRLMRQEKQNPETGSVARIGKAYERLCRGGLVGNDRGGRSDLGDIDDIDEELDLDLAPNLGTNAIAGRPISTGTRTGIVRDDEPASSTMRNLVLVTGVVVIAVILYFTQIGTFPIDTPPTGQEAIIAEQTIPPVPKSILAAPEQATAVGVRVETPAEAGTGQPTPLSATPETLAQQRVEEEANLKAIAQMETEAEAVRQAEEVVRLAELDIAAAVAAASRRAAEASAAAKAEAAVLAAAEKEAQVRAIAKTEAERKAAQAKQQEQARQLKQKQAMATTDIVGGGKRPESLSQAALNARVEQFKTAFQQGRLDQLMALFAPQARTDKQAGSVGIEAEYRALIEASDSRQISISKVNWSQKKNFATGLGRFKISLTPKTTDKKPVQPTVTTGEVTLQMERFGNVLQITRLYFSNPVGLPKALPPRPVRITKTELSQLIERFVSRYEKGDIAAFMSLFAEDAQSNDRSTVAGIRQDYADLFDGTVLRKLALTTLKWDWEGEEMARGEAQYEVKIQASGRSRVNTYKGMIWFQVERRAGEPRITHFAFVE